MNTRARAATLLAPLLVILASLPSPALARSTRIQEPTHLGMGLGIGSLAYGVSAKYYIDSTGSIQGNRRSMVMLS